MIQLLNACCRINGRCYARERSCRYMLDGMSAEVEESVPRRREDWDGEKYKSRPFERLFVRLYSLRTDRNLERRKPVSKLHDS